MLLCGRKTRCFFKSKPNTKIHDETGDCAIESSGPGWQAAYLAELLDDPYDAVRYIAGRSLRSHDGFEDFEYDYVANTEQLEAKVDEARERASSSGVNRADLRISSGRLDQDWAERLTLIRNDRDISIDE